jgi:hypothetical protein
MYAIQKQLSDGRKRYAKDIQAALHVEDLAANIAKNGDIYQLQHGLVKVHQEVHHPHQKGQLEGKRNHDHRGGNLYETANYSSHVIGNMISNSSANMSGGRKLCGKNVIHLDGRCDVYKSSGIRDTNNGSHANNTMDNRGKQQRVLFDGEQDCAQLFHLLLRAPNAMFDGLDDDVDDMLIDVGTPATAADPATTPEQPEWDANTFDTNAVFDDLGITFVEGVPVVPSYDDEPDTPQVVEETPEEVEEDDNNEENVFARDLPVPSMEGYPFRQPALDMVF